jgi:hypothetical protein
MMRKLLLVGMIGLLATPAMAVIGTPHVAGDMQGWDAGANPMTETAPGSGIWEATLSGMGAGARYEFKITDGTWDNSIPASGNSWLFADAGGNVTITYDANTYADGWSPTVERLGLSTDSPVGWTAVGSFQDEIGGTDWNNADPVSALLPQGGGIYSMTAVLPPGTYDWKAVVTGSWDAISWDTRGVNTANWSFTTDAVLDTVTLSVNGLDGTVSQVVTPEPASALLLLLGLPLLRRLRA